MATNLISKSPKSLTTEQLDLDIVSLVIMLHVAYI